MDTSPLEGSESIVRETTDAFCRSFCEERNFHGAFASTVGRGALPQGVDPQDPRVLEIKRRCRESTAMDVEAPFTD